MEDQNQSGVCEESHDFGRKATKEQPQQPQIEAEMVLPEWLVELPEDLEVSIILPSKTRPLGS